MCKLDPGSALECKHDSKASRGWCILGHVKGIGVVRQVGSALYFGAFKGIGIPFWGVVSRHISTYMELMHVQEHNVLVRPHACAYAGGETQHHSY